MPRGDKANLQRLKQDDRVVRLPATPGRSRTCAASKHYAECGRPATWAYRGEQWCAFHATRELRRADGPARRFGVPGGEAVRRSL